jgi:hypothetical protein
VPFGGGEHDWAALELGAWLSLAASASATCATRSSARSGASLSSRRSSSRRSDPSTYAIAR